MKTVTQNIVTCIARGFPQPRSIRFCSSAQWRHPTFNIAASPHLPDGRRARRQTQRSHSRLLHFSVTTNIGSQEATSASSFSVSEPTNGVASGDEQSISQQSPRNFTGNSAWRGRPVLPSAVSQWPQLQQAVAMAECASDISIDALFTLLGLPSFQEPSSTDTTSAELGFQPARQAARVRVRQHVNPLKAPLVAPVQLPAWHEIFADPSLPLCVDVGSASGRMLLALAAASATDTWHSASPGLLTVPGPGNGRSSGCGNGTAGRGALEVAPEAGSLRGTQDGGEDEHSARHMPSGGLDRLTSNGIHDSVPRQCNDSQLHGQSGEGQRGSHSDEQQNVRETFTSSPPPSSSTPSSSPAPPSIRPIPHNFLGLEIRQPLVARSNAWAAQLSLQNAHFMVTNATLALPALLASYPGPTSLVCVLCPDPHFKKRHRKRRVVQASLVEALSACLPAGCHVFVESDVAEVAEDMRGRFEGHGGFERVRGDGCEEREGGWLVMNPVGMPSERELVVLLQGQEMYRTLFVKM